MRATTKNDQLISSIPTQEQLFSLSDLGLKNLAYICGRLQRELEEIKQRTHYCLECRKDQGTQTRRKSDT